MSAGGLPGEQNTRIRPHDIMFHARYVQRQAVDLLPREVKVVFSGQEVNSHFSELEYWSLKPHCSCNDRF